MDSASATHHTFNNVGAADEYMKPIEVGDDWERIQSPIWVPGVYEWEYNDTTLYPGFCVILTDKYVVIRGGSAAGPDVDFSAGLKTISCDTANELHVQSPPDTDYTESFTYGYGVCEKGSYIYSKSNASIYVTGNTPILGVTAGTQNAITGYTLYYVQGTINDGFTVTPIAGYSNTTITASEVTDISADYSAVEGYDDLYLFKGVTFKATITHTVNGSSSTENLNDGACTRFIVPTEVQIPIPNAPSPIVATLYQLIPILMILGVIVVIAGYFKFHKESGL